ncbi:NUDIX domain-containing protein [Nocardia seriolae]|uniref:NUDIX hydrolase n=1 Tax=Nocardia seriolae TaxID=37332 RepID=UPI00119567F0|nr:bifunctional NUDIX hydrolase/histidine phosphatase family protein [Nocardia seriolae]GEM26462.1 putative hydrolase MutT/NUDIX [Nocardia seriolae NBRC 15557]
MSPFNNDPAAEYADPPVKANILAAGAVLWRPVPGSADGSLEIALVHRPKYDDWSLPKGKLDPGETPVITTVREVAEETGLNTRLGRYLGDVTYPVTGHRKLKRVDYWAARILDGTFEANTEVDVLDWCPLDRVMDALSYPMDRTIVRNFLRQPADTAHLLLVRHGKAGRSDRGAADDDARPLEKAGRAQARALVPNLLAFGASEILSAPPARCVQTVTPLAEKLGVTVELEPLLSESGYAAAPDAARKRARDLVSADSVRVICSQGKVIPDLLQWWAAEDGISLPPARNRKGSAWVLSFHEGRLIAADHLDRALTPVDLPQR